MIRISVSRADATVLETETLTAGRIGLVCEFVFSSDWDDLEKVAVFDGEVTREVMLDENNRAIVPAECMATAGYKLRCGVTGLNAEQVVVLPTVYVNAGKIRESAEIADSSIEEITPSLASQVISRANEALRVANELASDAESGRFDGEDGVSPTLNVTSITNGHRVSITDRDGTDEFDVMNGVNGEDGDSPTISVSDITGGHVLTITDKNGTRTVNVLDGEDGADGATGPAGSPGATGADGYSPTVTITGITGGHRVTVTDKNGDHTFDVMDGEDGEGGSSSTGIYGGSNVNITYWTDGTQTEACSVSKSDVPGAVVGDFIIGKRYGELSIMKAVRENTGMLFGDETIAIDSATIPTKTSDLTNDSGFVSNSAGNAYRAASIPMGSLDSSSTATAMTATIPGITELRDGVCVWLYNGDIASASGVTLNINGLGAKPIYNSLSGAVVTTTFTAASTYLFVYNSTRVDGGCWDMCYGYDANTTYTPVKLGFGYGTCTTAAATAAKTSAISSYTLTSGGIVAIKFSNDVPANATLNINSKGAKAIYYKGAAITAGVIKAGDTVTMIYSTYYHVLSIDRDEAPVTSVNGQTGAVTVTVPVAASSGTPAMDGTASLGSSTQYARADHRHPSDTTKYTKPSTGIPKSDLASAVQTSLGKADTALQSVPSTYRTAAAQDTIDAGKIDKNQGSANAEKFLGIGNDGIVVPVAAPSGGSEWELVMDFTTEEEVSSVSVSFDSTVRDKILAANEISFVSYFVSTTDSTITAKGAFTQRICSGDTWKMFLRPDNNSGNIVPASGQANNLYRIVHEQKCAPFGWFPGDDGTAPYLRHSGYTNSANPSISTSTGWGFDMSFAEYAQEIDNANFSTNTKFGVGTSFRIYVR